MYKCCELQRIVAILLQFYYKLRNQLNTFISYDKLKIVISKKLNTRNIANYNLKLKKRKVLWNAKPYNPCGSREKESHFIQTSKKKKQ